MSDNPVYLAVPRLDRETRHPGKVETLIMEIRASGFWNRERRQKITMSHMHSHESTTTNERIIEIDGRDVPEIKLMDHLQPAEKLLERTVEYFFSSQRF